MVQVRSSGRLCCVSEHHVSVRRTATPSTQPRPSSGGLGSVQARAGEGQQHVRGPRSSCPRCQTVLAPQLFLLHLNYFSPLRPTGRSFISPELQGATQPSLFPFVVSVFVSLAQTSCAEPRRPEATSSTSQRNAPQEVVLSALRACVHV